MKIVKSVAHVSFGEFLETAVKNYPSMKYHEDCDEFGCNRFFKESKWFGKKVCDFGYERITIYLDEYKNDIFAIVRQWENMSGEEFEVIIP